MDQNLKRMFNDMLFYNKKYVVFSPDFIHMLRRGARHETLTRMQPFRYCADLHAHTQLHVHVHVSAATTTKSS